MKQFPILVAIIGCLTLVSCKEEVYIPSPQSHYVRQDIKQIAAYYTVTNEGHYERNFGINSLFTTDFSTYNKAQLILTRDTNGSSIATFDITDNVAEFNSMLYDKSDSKFYTCVEVSNEVGRVVSPWTLVEVPKLLSISKQTASICKSTSGYSTTTTILATLTIGGTGGMPITHYGYEASDSYSSLEYETHEPSEYDVAYGNIYTVPEGTILYPGSQLKIEAQWPSSGYKRYVTFFVQNQFSRQYADGYYKATYDSSTKTWTIK